MAADDGPVLERFLVEVDLDSSGHDPALLTQWARRASEAHESGTSIRHVRTIYVPEDGSSYLLVEAGSAAEIEHALHAVGIETCGSARAIRAVVAKTREVDLTGGSR